MLLGWVWDLHPPGAANCRMGNISIAADFIACINYDHTFMKIICEHSCHLPDDGRLAYPCLESALLRDDKCKESARGKAVYSPGLPMKRRELGTARPVTDVMSGSGRELA